MFLVEILLPLYDNAREAFPREHFLRVRGELTERFGGLTAFDHSPAKGFWKENGQEATSRDAIVLFEVFTEHLDAAWWRQYREELQARFRQKFVVIRAHETQLL